MYENIERVYKTGWDNPKEEMRQRGCSDAQIKAKVVPIVLDILAQTPNEEYKNLSGLEEKSDDLKREIDHLQYEYRNLQMKAQAIENRTFDIDNYFEEKLKAFNEMLGQCETAEARDALRTAQLFMNATDVDTKYDNTAYIIGLASILSKGNISAIGELSKINKKIAMNTIDWR